MQGVTFDAWVGPAHHVRELDETWTLEEGGEAGKLFIDTDYFHFGQGIHLTPPVGAS